MPTARFKKTVTQPVEVEVPDYFDRVGTSMDQTNRDMLADMLIERNHGEPDRIRNDVWESVAERVEPAINTLTEAYKWADKIMSMLGVPEKKGPMR